jgi:hypothetical protein
MQLALELKIDLKDGQMSIHREYWKVIIANVFTAFTGLGLFAIGINYLVNGRVFFPKQNGKS